MTINKIALFLCLGISLLFAACDKAEVKPASTYDCDLSEISSLIDTFPHPKATIFQEILNDYQARGIVGVTALVKDNEGGWAGAAGMADIPSGVEMKACNRFLIGSISKVFTAAAIYTYIDDGVMAFDDPVSKWLPNSITDRIANANESQIKHLLSHRSGILDYADEIASVLNTINQDNFDIKQEDYLEFIYDKDANFAVDAKYEYSNSGYVLLGMILEQVSGKSLETVYQEKVFTPLGLKNAYYGQENPVTPDLVKSYVDLKNTGEFIESDFLDKDNLNTADGAIISNTYDIAMLIEGIYSGRLISSNSLAEMQNWFDIPEVDNITGSLSHFQNGYGLERYSTSFGNAVGHTGSIGGFWSFLHYFPEENRTYVLLFNNRAASLDGATKYLDLHNALLEAMFKD